MDRGYVRSLNAAHAERILESLSRQQYLHPHQAVRQAMAEAAGEVGFCPGAGESAMQWLQLNPEQSIGRLRRAQLVQLSQSIDGFWRQRPDTPLPQSKSA